MTLAPAPTSIERSNLALLVRLRWVAIAGQAMAIGAARLGLGIALPLVQMMAVLALLVGVNLWARHRSTGPRPVTLRLLTAEILSDVLALTVLLYLSGGATNPFAGLFILQDLIAIVLLPPLEAGIVVGVSLMAAAGLLGLGQPMALPQNLTRVGNYLSFGISAVLAAWFIMGIRRNLARRDVELAAAKAQIDEEAMVLRIGLMASTAAHDLGTPLTNLAVILDDWADLGLPAEAEVKQQAALMQEAVAVCRETISRLLQAAGAARLEAAGALDAAAFAGSVAESWRVTHPQVAVLVDDQRKHPGRIIADVLLRRALLNLLDNAAEAGSTIIRVAVSDAGLGVEIAVCDNGPGFPAVLLASGPGAFHSGHSGASRGLGLFLVQSVLRRVNGELRLANIDGGGAKAAIVLPFIA